MTPRISSFCSSGGCVQVTFNDDGTVTVNHSRYPSPLLVFTRSEWVAFLAGVHNREFEAEEA